MAERSGTSNEFTGKANSILQAGSIQGGVHVHHVGPTLPTPNQLPMAPSLFVNREAAIRRLDHFVDPTAATGPRDRNVAVVTVAGPPGVGKSALAVHWAHRVKDSFPDGALFVDMQGYSSSAALDPGSALGSFLRALGTSPETIPLNLQDRAALFRSVVAGKRLLILVDNVRSTAQVRHLIPATTECLVLVTSRSRLAGLGTREATTRVNLDVLTPEQSMQLLAELLGEERVDQERVAALRLAELCGFLPLALRVLCDRAADKPEASLHDLVHEVEGERSRLDVLAVAEDELSDTRAVFSWSYRSLTPDLRKLFRFLGLHPGTQVSMEVAAALAGTDVSTARRLLRALVDVHLVSEPAPGRFEQHDLLRLYGQELTYAEDGQAVRTDALRRALGWYLAAVDAARQAVLPFAPSVPLMPVSADFQVRFESPSRATSWFAVERPNLMAALHEAMDLGQYDFCWKLPIVATGLFEVGWHLKDWEYVHRLGEKAAATVGDPFGEALNVLLLGDAMWRQGNLDQAATEYRRAAELGRILSAKWVEGFAMRGLGLLEEELGNVTAARQHFESSLEILRRAHHRRGEAMSLLSIGTCARMQGDPLAGVARGFEALEILHQIGDQWTAAWAQISIAASLRMAGREAQAIDELRLSIATFREIGDANSEVLALTPLVDLLESRHDHADARQALLRIAELYDEMNNPLAEQARERAAAIPDQ